MDAGCGKYIYEGPNGELIRERIFVLMFGGLVMEKETTITTIITALMTTAKPLMEDITDPT